MFGENSEVLGRNSIRLERNSWVFGRNSILLEMNSYW